MTTLRMPDLGTVEGTVTLVRWLKREGEAVALGEPLFEVETDKGVSEVESAAEGTLVSRLVAEGAAVASGDPIATIQGKADRASPSAPRAAAPASARAEAGAQPLRVPASAAAQGSTASARGPAPSLIALARKHGVDLSAISGSGPGGAVTRPDVLKARDSGTAAAAPGDLPGAGPGPTPGSGLGALQSVVAARVSQSHREKPVYHVTMRVDMTRTIAARGGRSFTAFFVKACAAALTEMPVFRKWLAGSEVRAHNTADIAVAIGVDEDLFAPAVRNAGARGLDEISADIERLAARARAGSLGASDSQDTCFLVSNLGAHPVDSFDAVIAPEHAAALAVAAAVPTPVAVGGTVRIVPLASMTLSVDHRLVNGGTAARFLARVKQLLEEGLE